MTSTGKVGAALGAALVLAGGCGLDRFDGAVRSDGGGSTEPSLDGEGGSPCWPGKIYCEGACVIQDDQNCGACGASCPRGQQCIEGSCHWASNPPPTPMDGGASQPDCGAKAACPVPMDAGPPAYACFDLQTDPRHCGSCGTSCGWTEPCVSGACVKCVFPFENNCGSNSQLCVDVRTNVDHCGSCGNACLKGWVCGASGCEQSCTQCGNACVDLRDDEANCGACGSACNGRCLGGNCCPQGTLFCGGQCRPAGACAQLALDDDTACAYGTTLSCWGYWYLGDGTNTRRNVAGPVSGMTTVASLSRHCAIPSAPGKVKCWGTNWYGRLGDGTKTSSLVPVDALNLTDAVRVASDDDITCAVTAQGSVKCWGYNGYGAVGDGTNIDRTVPTDVVGLGSGVIAIDVSRHACAVTSGGAVKCWGLNSDGQLGDGTKLSRSTPVQVVGLSSGIVSVTAGRDYTCAVLVSGGVKCWGYNWSGQLGDGTNTTRPTPVDVVGLTGVVSVAAGWGHTCALRTGGDVWCWGANNQGQLGDGQKVSHTTPVAAAVNDALAIAAGAHTTCALLSSGEVRCWGDNFYLQIGDGTTGGTRPSPTRVKNFP